MHTAVNDHGSDIRIDVFDVDVDDLQQTLQKAKVDVVVEMSTVEAGAPDTMATTATWKPTSSTSMSTIYRIRSGRQKLTRKSMSLSLKLLMQTQ